MNILHILDERWDSGITNYGITLAKGQKQKGHRVIIACPPGSPSQSQAKSLGMETYPINFWNRYVGLTGFVRNNKIDIIHVHTGSGNFAGWLARNNGAKLVRTRADIRQIRRNVFSEIIIKKTDHIICAAKFIADDIAKSFPDMPKAKISVVYQGIEMPANCFFNDFAGKAPLKIGILGRLDPVKGHKVFINAARVVLEHFPETKFLVAGREENIKWPELLELLERLSIAGSFNYKGYVKSASDFMNSADVGVIASVGSEAVSRAALEWMASGKALVAGRTGCLGELIDDGRDGLLFDAGDHLKLAEHLISLAKDRRKITELGRSAFQKVKKQFNAASFIGRVEKIYNDL